MYEREELWLLPLHLLITVAFFVHWGTAGVSVPR